MVKQRILIVEDEKHISKLIKYNLEKAEYACAIAPTGEKATELLKEMPFDLVLLDIMLPGMSGLDLCRDIKQDLKLKAIPIVIISAKGEEMDRIVGLELGADDYIVKPFSVRELVLKAKAILKRGTPPPVGESKKEMLAAGDIVINIPRHEVTVNGKKVTLTLIEFKLLTTLIERQGRIQSRETLLTDVWNIYTIVDTRTVDTYVKRLRAKLGKPGNIIETVRGLGYKLKEDLEN